MSDAVEAILRRVLPGADLQGLRALGGGDTAQSFRVDTSVGAFVLKVAPGSGLDDMFAAEAAGLNALRAALSGCSDLQVPEVRSSASDHVLIDWICPGPKDASWATRLGRGLAWLHAQPAGTLGFDRATYCGPTRQDNAAGSDWPSFYREKRLGPMGVEARRIGWMDATLSKQFERLLSRLDHELSGSDVDRVSLLHGDLWSGNVLCGAGGQPALIDPAVYRGHREAEFGMALWLGGVPPAALRAYQEALPLAPGWQARLPIYTLYHVMNHANLFGGGYGAEAQRIIRHWA